jgi:uncharacterized protein
MKTPRDHIPFRTCIACGAKRPKRELQRLILSETGEIGLDAGKTQKGRGAYVCSRYSCRDKLRTHKRLSRVFRTQGQVRLSGELHNVGESRRRVNGAENSGPLESAGAIMEPMKTGTDVLGE